ncbi:unnamed protein product, partial [Lymnaea stagnalis]
DAVCVCVLLKSLPVISSLCVVNEKVSITNQLVYKAVVVVLLFFSLVQGFYVGDQEMTQPQFSQEQISDFQEAFGLFDKDSDGLISTADVGVVIRSLGGVITDGEISSMVRQFDHKNGLIDFADFLALMATIMGKKESPDELLQAFQVFDRDGNGFISSAELRHVMTNLGEKLSDEDVE